MLDSFCPSTRIFPLSGLIYPAKSLINVVFPHHDSPTNAVLVPQEILSEKF
jgi:hypothetical protein